MNYKSAVTFALALAAAPAFGQGLEPGEWQFKSTIASPMMQGVQSSEFTRCVRNEDSGKPETWMGSQDQKQSDCKVTTTKKSAESVSWEITCQKTAMRGTGTASFGRGVMESEQRMTGEMQGQKFDMVIKTNARRVGACKS